MAQSTGPDAAPLAVAAVLIENQGGAAASGMTGIGGRESNGD
jgi:hypothetical protein